MTVDDLTRLVNEGGEACVPLVRGFHQDPKALSAQQECCGGDCCSR